MKSAPGTIHRTTQLRAVFIDIILLLLTKADKHIIKSREIKVNHSDPLGYVSSMPYLIIRRSFCVYLLQILETISTERNGGFYA